MDGLPDEKVMCPYTGFEKKCFDMVVHCKCPKWVQVLGHNPNTGEQMNRWACADSWMPLLTIENSQRQYQTGAEISALRVDLVKIALGEPLAIAAPPGGAINVDQTKRLT